MHFWFLSRNAVCYYFQQMLEGLLFPGFQGNSFHTQSLPFFQLSATRVMSGLDGLLSVCVMYIYIVK